MAMFALLVAGLLEVAWATALKSSDGFTKPVPTALFLVFAALSLGLLSWALKTLPVGTAYAIWTGIGAVGTAIAGIALYSEAVTAPRLFGIALIVGGVIVLNLSEMERTA